MKLNRIIALGFMTGLLSCSFCDAYAQGIVKCMIFTGDADNEHCIDLTKLNRIIFDDNGMSISSSKDPSAQRIKLLYSLYNHLVIGDATPSNSSGLNSIETEDKSCLSYNKDAKSLVIKSSTESVYSLGIFDINGKLLMSLKTNVGQLIPVDALYDGVYVAVATNNESKLTLKFILKK